MSVEPLKLHGTRPFHEPSIGGSSECYTPPSIFAALKLEFDLDPASPGQGLCFVPAKYVYTQSDDGLIKPWFGLVWCNPPFGVRNSHVPWLRRFFDHGNGIALCRAYTSSGWFHDVVVPRVESLVFPKGKTQFVKPDGSVGKEPGHGTALLGAGKIANAALKRSGLGLYIDLSDQ